MKMGSDNSKAQLTSENSRASNEEEQVRAFKNLEIEKKKNEVVKMKEVLKDPWRKIDKQGWNEDELLQMKNEVAANKFPESINMFNILLVGHISAGKSSIINTIVSAINGDEVVTNKAVAGAAGQSKSVTKQLRSYKIKEAHVKFWDTMGLEVEDEGLDIQTVCKILDGKVKNYATLDGTLDPSSLRDAAEFKHQMHCVIFAVHAEKFAALDENILGKLTKIRNAANERDIPCLVVCTAVDLVCDHVKKDTSKVFYSQNIRKMFTMVSERSGFPLNMIHPQRNYVKEMVKELNIDFLTLLLFKQIHKVSIDF